jgi:hypothetical protein
MLSLWERSAPFASLTLRRRSSHADWWRFALVGTIHPAWRSVSAAFATASPLATGNWDLGNQLSPCTPYSVLSTRLRRQISSRFPACYGPVPLLRFQSISTPVSRVSKSRTSRLHSFGHSFLLHATTAHPLRIFITDATGKNIATDLPRQQRAVSWVRSGEAFGGGAERAILGEKRRRLYGWLSLALGHEWVEIHRWHRF